MTKYALTQVETDALEAMIDKTNVATVIDALCDICGEKSDHIRDNWQDKELSRLWRKRAVKLLNLSDESLFQG